MKMKFITGDRHKFNMMEEASAHCSKVFTQKGIVISLVELKPKIRRKVSRNKSLRLILEGLSKAQA